MDKQQKWVRLQVSGGAGFNFILPANPNWKVHQLQDHMLNLYNQIAASQLSSMRATKIKSLRRNGFFVATSLRVGHAFNDWDEVTCAIVTKNQKDETSELNNDKKELKKSSASKQTQKKQTAQRKKSQQVEEKKTDKVQSVNEKKKKNKDDSHEEKEKPSPASLSADKLLNMMELVRQNIKQDKKPSKQDAPKDQKKAGIDKQVKTKEQKKSKAIIIEQESD